MDASTALAALLLALVADHRGTEGCSRWLCGARRVAPVTFEVPFLRSSVPQPCYQREQMLDASDRGEHIPYSLLASAWPPVRSTHGHGQHKLKISAGLRLCPVTGPAGTAECSSNPGV